MPLFLTTSLDDQKTSWDSRVFSEQLAFIFGTEQMTVKMVDWILGEKNLNQIQKKHGKYLYGLVTASDKRRWECFKASPEEKRMLEEQKMLEAMNGISFRPMNMTFDAELSSSSLASPCRTTCNICPTFIHNSLENLQCVHCVVTTSDSTLDKLRLLQKEA